MRSFKITLAASLCCLLAVSVAGAADESAADLQQLIERLDRQEQRICELESQLKDQPAVDDRPRPMYFIDETVVDENEDDGIEVDSAKRGSDQQDAILQREKATETHKKVESLEEEWEKFREKEAKKNADAAKKPTIKIFGRTHLDTWSFPGDSPYVNALESGDPNISPQDRWVFRRIRIGASGTINDNMLYKTELELAGGNASEFRDVYLGFTDLPWLQTLLIGNQKRPYGLDHLNSSRYNVFLERPFIIEGNNQDARRLGIVSYGVSDDQNMNWRYGIYNQRLIQDEGGYIGDHRQLEFAFRLAGTPWYDESSGGRGYLHLGVAGTFAHPDGEAPNDGTLDNEARFRHRPEARSTSRWLDTGRIAGTDWYELFALESVLNVGAFQMVAEYQNLWLQRGDTFGPNVEFQGGYVQASYLLTGEHHPWDRKLGILGRLKPFENFFLVEDCCGRHGGGWGAWEVAARYSYADYTDADILGGIGESLTLGVNWYWNAYARMQFNYIHGEIRDGQQFAGVNDKGDYHIIGTRLSIDF